VRRPRFSVAGRTGGQASNVLLETSAAKRPVVLYFFPAAFSKGCTIEAHAFAEATDDFKKLGATVIGVTAGNVDQVDEFSKLECRDKFTVTADPARKSLRSTRR
jgi:peroxiredoxin